MAISRGAGCMDMAPSRGTAANMIKSPCSD
ncbi:hypothetical protein COLO4_32996 [Corchorus olitorius]|uniref:Uncharacterized protein n=1 Tax=Corchorus olitorius TaxID=93759 RepID=A0A1R3GX82_9ROSI|nr:hypothetical protein COLO4_32996 [Corchorus olitorius]